VLLDLRVLQAVESVLHALVEQDVLESLLTAAPAELVMALLQLARSAFNNPNHVESAVAVMHRLLTCRPGFAKGSDGVECLQQTQSILAEELRTQEQLLSVLGVVRGLALAS